MYVVFVKECFNIFSSLNSEEKVRVNDFASEQPCK